MDESEFAVKYLVACRRVEVTQPVSRSEYTLHDVAYAFDIPSDREWPARIDELWLFVRFYNGEGTKRFTLSVFWLAPPTGGEVDIAHYDLVVRFPPDTIGLNWAWNVSRLQFPGQGRYVFRLSDDENGELLADEHVLIRREV